MPLVLAVAAALAAQAPSADTAAAVRWTRAALALWDDADADRQRGRAADLPAPLVLTTALALAQNDAAPDPAAVASASAAVLAGLFPDRADAVAARLAEDLARLAPDTLGAARGRRAGQRRLVWFAGLAEAAPVPLRVGEGWWAADPGRAAVGIEIPAFPLLVLDSASALRPPPPPALGDAAFEAALDTVRQATRERTAAQRRAARRWARRSAYLAWAETAADLLAPRAGEAEAARVFAVLHAALYDATVACFEAKYHYLVPRPSHLDPSITLPFLVDLPHFPAYPAGHGCSAGVAETVLAWAVPEAAPVVRAEAAEMAESRLWAGVHYPFDNRAGVALGRAVAGRVIARADALAAR